MIKIPQKPKKKMIKITLKPEKKKKKNDRLKPLKPKL